MNDPKKLQRLARQARRQTRMRIIAQNGAANSRRHPERDPRGYIPKRRLGELCKELPRGSMQVFASALGVAPRTVNNWIRGETFMGDVQVVKAAAILTNMLGRDVCAFDLLDYEVTRSEDGGRVAAVAAKDVMMRSSTGAAKHPAMALHDLAVSTLQILDGAATVLDFTASDRWMEEQWEAGNDWPKEYEAPADEICQIVCAVIPGVFNPLLEYPQLQDYRQDWQGEPVETFDFCGPRSNHAKEWQSDGGGALEYIGAPEGIAPGQSFIDWWRDDGGNCFPPQYLPLWAGIDPETYREKMRRAFLAIPTDFRSLIGVARAVGEVGAESGPVAFILGAGALLNVRS